MLEGVWKRIGHVKFENRMPSDTIFYPTDSITNIRTGKNSPGTRYKIYGGGHSIWFTGAYRKDSKSIKNSQKVTYLNILHLISWIILNHLIYTITVKNK